MSLISRVFSSRLTVELQDGVVYFALQLSGALEGAGHPQPLVHGHGRDDVVPDVGGHLPLRQDGPHDQPHDAHQRQEEAQQLDPGVRHDSVKRRSVRKG